MKRWIGIALVPLLAAACTADTRDETPAPEAARAETAPPAAATGLTLADFQALAYLEGDWRGSGYAGGPFYESYRFVNDSTIEMTAWTDSTLSVPGDSSRYMLRGGEIHTADDGRLVAVDADGHHFRRGSSAWTFRQVSPDRWTAQVGPTTTYTMDRIARP